MSHWVLSAIVAAVPLAFVALVVAAKEMGLNPKMTPEEFERLVEAIKESEWAKSLAARMATTPEAQKLVAERLARGLAQSIARMM
jgi:hypothetical protein